MDNYVITVARGFGSGGKEIASKIAKKLGIACYENRILTLASQYTGYDEEEFKRVDEKLDGNYFGKLLADLPRTLKPQAKKRGFHSDDRLFGYQAEIIRKLADTESCVIVGKCADYILRDYDNVISIYVEAPRDFCFPRIMEKMNVSEQEAHTLIEKTDKYRADYYKYYTHGNYWTNPVNYDMTLNSQRVGIDTCVELVIDYVQKKFGK